MEISLQMKLLAPTLYATATIFPSIEYANARYCEWDMFNGEGMAPVQPPVWRSQVVNSEQPQNCVHELNERLSGEKLSHRVPPPEGCVKV